MKQRTHEDFVALIRERLAKKQYDELFAGGCCFHFALRAYAKGVGTLAYTRAALNPAKKGHVFVITVDGRAFDRKGYRELGGLKKEFGEWGDEPHFSATPDEIAEEAAARKLPPEVEAAVNALADEIIAQKV